jgi:alkyl sulfatase BDS1-like metallo-beta-lactamase superfamily hydrolase
MLSKEELEVVPSIVPELKAHTKHFDKKIYTVTDNVYLAVGWNAANTVFIDGDDGLIVIDVGEAPSHSRELLAEFRKMNKKPIKAIIYTHFHPDHINGTKAFVDEADVKAGKVDIYAHETLMSELVVQASQIGPILSTRTGYSLGAVIRNAHNVDMNAGLGFELKPEYSMFLAPTITFKDRLDVTICGVKLEMIHLRGETDDGVVVYLPETKVACTGDLIQGPSFPNVHTLRGTKYRDPAFWFDSIDYVRRLKPEFMAGSHGQPLMGAEETEYILCAYRDAIQYVHDQTVRYMNKGLIPDQIVDLVKLPPHLAEIKPWIREYYGTLKHSIRQIYQGLLGWFQGDPVDLNPTPMIEKARRMVEMMGGREKVLEAACAAYKAKDYQWAAELTTFIIRINIEDMDARHLKAACYKQLAYASMNINWRFWYLTSSYELDGELDPEGLRLTIGYTFSSPDTLSAFPTSLWLKEWTARIDPAKSVDTRMTMAFKVKETDEVYALEIRRGIVQFHETLPENVDLTVSFTRQAFEDMIMNEFSIAECVENGDMDCDKDVAEVTRFLNYFDLELTPIQLSLR